MEIGKGDCATRLLKHELTLSEVSDSFCQDRSEVLAVVNFQGCPAPYSIRLATQLVAIFSTSRLMSASLAVLSR